MNLYDMLSPESPYVFYDSDHGFCINTEDVFNLIEQLQLTGHWIPCSKMEPKKSGHYLCTHGGTGIVSPDIYTTQEQAEEWFGDPEDEYLDLEEYIGWNSKNVIAWMPLPAEYKEEREEMIQWCEDCKHSPWDEQSYLTMNEKALEICEQCLDNSKPGEQPIKWEKREKNGDFVLS